jgi:hypothetical protein
VILTNCVFLLIPTRRLVLVLAAWVAIGIATNIPKSILPGGFVVEAMKIGRLVRALRWESIVPSPITNPYIKPETIFSKNQLL